MMLTESASPTNQTALQRPPPEIELKFNIFHRFDRPILVQCVETMLEDKQSRDMMIKLIKAATITTYPWFLGDPHEERWANASRELKSYRLDGQNQGNGWKRPIPFSTPFSTDIVQFDPRRAPTPAGEVLDLHQLYNMMPSGEGDYSLALLDYGWQLFLGVIYSLTAFTSFFLNLITVIVLTKSSKGELRRYLINLSVSDLLMSCFSIPVTYTEFMLGSWILPRFLCPLGHFVVTLGVFVSTATMIVIGINRHSAIMHPLKLKKPTKIRHWRVRQIHVIIGIWLLGIAISSPEYLMVHAAPFCFNKKLYFECRTIWPESVANSYTIFIFLSTFLVPLSLLSFIYIRLALRMWNHKTPGNQNANQDHSMQEQRTKVFKMLLVVVIVFVISWLPIQIYSLVNLLFPELRKSVEYQSVNWNIAIATYFTSHWLSMAHSCINPLIYGFMSKKFRRDLKKRLFWAHWPIGRDQHQTSNAMSSGFACGSKLCGGAVSLEERANFQRSLMSRKSCRSPNDFDLKRPNRANGSALDTESPEPIAGQLEFEFKVRQGDQDEAGDRKGGDDEPAERHSTCDQMADGQPPEAGNGHEGERATEDASLNGFASAAQRQQQQQLQSSCRYSDETFVMVEFHEQKYTTRVSSSDKLPPRSPRQTMQRVGEAELEGRSIEANNNINRPTCVPGARLGCCDNIDLALPIVPTLHEEEEDELDKEEEDAAEELADGNCARPLNSSQDVEARFGAIKQQQQRLWCERNLVEHEQSNDSSMKLNRFVIIVSSPSSPSSLSQVANV